MVLQILADAFECDARWDLLSTELLGIANARQHQKLRRVDDATRQHDLAFGTHGAPVSVLQHLDPDGAISLKQHAGRERVGHNPQIFAPQGRIEVSDRATAAPSAPDRVLAVAKAQLLSAVE